MKVLHYSGGMDSLACLELLKDEPGLTVITALTDGSYPDKEEYLDKVEHHYNHLKFVRVYQDRHLERFGQPVDVVPIKFTGIGHMISLAPIKYQSVFECCSRGIWIPVHQKTRELGATVVYRGQRGDDAMKAPIQDGHVEDGILFRFPIQEWTREQVVDFVNERVPELIPEYYAKEQTSRDCWDCTAYLHENIDRIHNLPPDKRAHVTDLLDEWRQDINNETRW